MIASLRYALKGVAIAWREEQNFKIDVVCALVAIFLGWYFSITRVEWMVVIFLIGFVLSAEAFNTALEELCDMYKRDPDPHIAKIKDLAAAAVLVASVASAIIGGIIFIPYIV